MHFYLSADTQRKDVLDTAEKEASLKFKLKSEYWVVLTKLVVVT